MTRGVTDSVALVGSEQGLIGLVAYVAAATIAVSSIYMILANHELLLLTGKNVYLLGLDSAGDVIETMALLLVIAFGLAPMRPDDPTARSAAATLRRVA